MTVATAGLAAFALVIGGLSVLGVVRPSRLVRFVSRAMTTWGYSVAVLARLCLAALLWFAAPATATPLALKALATVVLLSAAVIVVAGKARVATFVQRFGAWPEAAVRLWCLVGVAFGAFLLWAVLAVGNSATR